MAIERGAAKGGVAFLWGGGEGGPEISAERGRGREGKKKRGAPSTCAIHVRGGKWVATKRGALSGKGRDDGGVGAKFGDRRAVSPSPLSPYPGRINT